MPLSLRDPQLRSAYRTLEAKHLANPDFTIQESDLVDLLAGLADRKGDGSERVAGALSVADAKTQLQALAAKGDRAGMLALVQDGLDLWEQQDLIKLLGTLESQRVPLAESVRNFFAAALGREPLKPLDPNAGDGGSTGPSTFGTDALAVLGDQRDGVVHVKTTPNAQLFGLDLAEVVKDRKHVGAAWGDNDWIPVGQADAQGNASIKLGGPSMRGLEGDPMRLGAQSADGKQTILDIRARRGDLSDTTNADVNVGRIQAQLSANGDGTISLTSNDEGREISDPGATLYFVNTRTRQGKQITLDANGKLPAGAAIPGVKGDSFFIAVSDGVNNKDFSQFITVDGTNDRVQLSVAAGSEGGGDNGTLHIAPEPTLYHDELDPVTHQPKYQLVKYKGELGPVDAKLAVQGHLGDCYYPSAMKTMSRHWPDVIEHAIEIAKDKDGNVIKDKDGDPCYVAHFKAVDWNDPSKVTNIDVGPFTSELWARSDGSPIYMREGLWGDGDDKDHMNLRYPLLEKAYAIWKGKGSYEGIGAGGLSSEVFQDFTGKIAKNVDIGENDGPKLQALVEDAEKKGLPWSLGTYPEAGSEARYQGTGYFADHSYAGIGIGKGTPNDDSGRGGSADDGPKPQVMLTLEQPWNEQIPGDLGDGVAKITPEAAAKLFQTFMSVEA